jgi:hypothetical protein
MGLPKQNHQYGVINRPGLSTFCFVLKELVYFGDGTVEGNDFEAMVGSIHDQVLAHDGQTNKAKITTGFGTRG